LPFGELFVVDVDPLRRFKFVHFVVFPNIAALTLFLFKFFLAFLHDYLLHDQKLFVVLHR
jgi:hypothetical protein